LKGFWDELSTYVNIPKCTCGGAKEFATELEKEKVHQFLMGLNDTFNTIRTQILATDPLPNLSRVYALVCQEEKQRHVVLDRTPNINAAALAVNRVTLASNNVSTRSKERCDHCNKPGHTKDRCFEIIGYPSNWRPKSKNERGGRGTHQNRHAFAAAAGLDSSTMVRDDGLVGASPIPGLSTMQYNQLIQLLGAETQLVSANQAGERNSFIPPNSDTWVIDSGASDHMVSSSSTLNESLACHNLKPVRMPNGYTTLASHSGNVVLSPDITLNNVLCVPNFKLNLLSISKLTSSMNCAVIFFPTFCLFQDLVSKRLIGVGEI
jgi:hypothetical protein